MIPYSSLLAQNEFHQKMRYLGSLVSLRILPLDKSLIGGFKCTTKSVFMPRAISASYDTRHRRDVPYSAVSVLWVILKCSANFSFFLFYNTMFD